MPVQNKPIIHGRDHCPDGADPIPCLPTAAGGTTYPDLIQAHPCLVHYWPADEPSGDLVDRAGAWDLEPVTNLTYPRYGYPGPLTELPQYTAVGNVGASGALGYDNRFTYTFGSAPPFWTLGQEFSVELWLNLFYIDPGGAPTFLDASGGGGGLLTVYLFSPVGSPTQLTVDHGPTNLIDPDPLPLDAWQHIVVRYNGTTVELIRNGNIVDSAPSAGVAITNTLTWLNNVAGPSWSPTNGYSAQLAIYDCALSDSDIGQHLDAQTSSGDVPSGYVLTSDGDGGTTWEPGGVTATDTLAWMPLTTVTGGVPELVWSADDSLIPTLITLE